MDGMTLTGAAMGALDDGSSAPGSDANGSKGRNGGNGGNGGNGREKKPPKAEIAREEEEEPSEFDELQQLWDFHRRMALTIWLGLSQLAENSVLFGGL